jgi:hypothetical protein
LDCFPHSCSARKSATFYVLLDWRTAVLRPTVARSTWNSLSG